MPIIDERRRRVNLICDALDDPHNPTLVTRYADIIGAALKQGYCAQQFFTRLAPILRVHGITTPPSLHTWRAVQKELMRRAATTVPGHRH